MITSLWGVGSTTLRETLRQPAFGIVIALAIGGLVLVAPAAGYTFDNDQVMVHETGLSLLLLAGLILAAIAASKGLHEEIRRATTLTVLTKPISRTTFLLGKFLGCAAAVTIGMYLLTIVYLLVVRYGSRESVAEPYDLPALIFGLGGGVVSLLLAAAANYWKRRHFPTAAIGIGSVVLTVGLLIAMAFESEFELHPYASEVPLRVVLAAILVWQAVIVLVAVALAASTRLAGLPTFFITLGVLAGGLVAEGLLAGGGGTFYTFVPNFNIFWTADVLIRELPMPMSYVLQASVYGLCWLVAALAIGAALFETRETA